VIKTKTIYFFILINFSLLYNALAEDGLNLIELKFDDSEYIIKCIDEGIPYWIKFNGKEYHYSENADFNWSVAYNLKDGSIYEKIPSKLKDKVVWTKEQREEYFNHLRTFAFNKIYKENKISFLEGKEFNFIGISEWSDLRNNYNVRSQSVKFIPREIIYENDRYYLSGIISGKIELVTELNETGKLLFPEIAEKKYVMEANLNLNSKLHINTGLFTFYEGEYVGTSQGEVFTRKTEFICNIEGHKKIPIGLINNQKFLSKFNPSDTQIPLITATSSQSSQTNVIISGTVRDNVAVAEVTIDGEPIILGSDGYFETSLYVPRSGKTVEIIAFDKKGNKASKSLRLERDDVQQATGPVYASLNPSGKRVRQNKDALALIIGVAEYERTTAKAAYADKDAKTFYDYAMLKLGIPSRNIKELVNVDANRVDVSLAVKDWLARSIKQNKSDIYIFFAGHGLANQSGEQMYLLPYDGSPRLLDDSAISRERLFNDIALTNPRSVTVFLDTCYSGTTRGTDMLIASRPIAIRALEQDIPDNFTVFTAAAGDQTAKPLEEAKHGMFSYYLMKGMEGEADTNGDNKITSGELHEFVYENVTQQSYGSQTPQLQGDTSRVLVSFQ